MLISTQVHRDLIEGCLKGRRKQRSEESEGQWMRRRRKQGGLRDSLLTAQDLGWPRERPPREKVPASPPT